jgi:hypothetical protein
MKFIIMQICNPVNTDFLLKLEFPYVLDINHNFMSSQRAKYCFNFNNFTADQKIV